MALSIYDQVRLFKSKHPLTVSWRIKSHCKVIESHLNPGEVVEYAFACQKGESAWDMISTYVVALTNQRLILATKRVVFGYFFYSITPDMYNDLEVRMGLIWGNIHIDTVKEEIILSNISKSALDEIETAKKLTRKKSTSKNSAKKTAKK